MMRGRNVEQFQIGDRVKLRAGGEQMQIVELEDGGAKCLWYLGLQQQLAWVSLTVLVRSEKSLRHRLVQTLETSM